MNILNVSDIAEQRLCVGCGACAYICPEKKIQLRNVASEGIRPFVGPGGCDGCDECVRTCPGYEIAHGDQDSRSGVIEALSPHWGPVLEVWEGYATDPEIRLNGSSGGMVSALALYCLEKEGMHGVLHTGATPTNPIVNMTTMSRRREDILSRTGSRYAPASPCDGLASIEASIGLCLFIGKPCDVAGLRKAMTMRKGLGGKIGLAIGFFCAGTPSTMGTLDLLKNLNVAPSDLDELRYRGKGWPGNFSGHQRSKSPAHSVSHTRNPGDSCRSTDHFGATCARTGQENSRTSHAAIRGTGKSWMERAGTPWSSFARNTGERSCRMRNRRVTLPWNAQIRRFWRLPREISSGNAGRFGED